MKHEKERHELSALEQLEQLRDIARVQAHLFKEDMKDEWEKLEEKRKELKRRMRPVEHAARETSREIDEASSQLIHSLTDGYKRIVKAAKKLV